MEFVHREVLSQEEDQKSSQSEESDQEDNKQDFDGHTSSKRKVYSESFKRDVISYYITYNFAMTLAKFTLPYGTLKSWIYKYSQLGDEFFLDKRALNKPKSIDEADVVINEFISNLRKYHLPVTASMVKQKALQVVTKQDFTASDRWFQNFLKRSRLALRKKTHVVQKLKDDYKTEVLKYFSKLDEIRKGDERIIFLNFDEVAFPLT